MPTFHLDRSRKEDGRTFVETFGVMYIAHMEIVNARDVNMKTLEGLVLTVEAGSSDAYFATKWVYAPGLLNNYASIHIFDDSGTGIDAATYGSTYVNFIAWGE